MAKRPETIETPATEQTPGSGKGHATPSRAEREAARRRPLVPADRKEAAKQARAQNAEARERARVGMAAGDERYLTVRDRGPQRRFVRDHVDARFTIAEFLMPIVVLMLVSTVIPSKDMQTYMLIAIWAFVLIAAVDFFLMNAKIRSRLREKFGTLDRGLTMYAAMRAMQIRRIRLPKPQVKRGQFPS